MLPRRKITNINSRKTTLRWKVGKTTFSLHIWCFWIMFMPWVFHEQILSKSSKILISWIINEAAKAEKRRKFSFTRNTILREWHWIFSKKTCFQEVNVLRERLAQFYGVLPIIRLVIQFSVQLTKNFKFH